MCLCAKKIIQIIKCEVPKVKEYWQFIKDGARRLLNFSSLQTLVQL